VILCNKTVRSALVNSARSLTYSGAPSVPMVASIRAGYHLLMSGETQKVWLLSCSPLCVGWLLINDARRVRNKPPSRTL
jgi:hypothetical protein